MVTYLYTEGWTSSSLGGGSCRTDAPGGWGACRSFAPQIVVHRNGLPPGVRRAQASPLFRDKESRPPAWGLPERDSFSLRIGQLSWGDPRRTGGKKLGRSFGSLSSDSFLVARTGALLVACSSEALKNKGLNRKDRVEGKIPYSLSFPLRRTNYKTPPLGWIFSVFLSVIKGYLCSRKNLLKTFSGTMRFRPPRCLAVTETDDWAHPVARKTAQTANKSHLSPRSANQRAAAVAGRR